MWIEVSSSAAAPVAACLRWPGAAKLVDHSSIPATRNDACSATVAVSEASAAARMAGACQPQTATSSSKEKSTGDAAGMEAPGRQRSGRPMAISGAATATTPIWATMPAAREPRHAPSSGPSQIRPSSRMAAGRARRLIAGIP